MNVDLAREYLLSLPDVVETHQWGDNLVFWVGDKAIGGKMFAVFDLSANSKSVASFAAGPERSAELLELDGLLPAPYFARIFWVGAAYWSALRDTEWREHLAAAHERTCEKLPPKVQRVLAMTKTEQKKLIAAARKSKAAAKS
jgi:predicted DNA-binding protein (MmcQ/YjbR family)